MVIGGGAIGCEFASMLTDLGAKVTDPRGAAEDPAGLRRRRHQARRCAVQEARHRRPHRRGGHGPHARTTAAAPPCASARARRSRSTSSSCRSAAARYPRACWRSRAPRSRSTSAASSRSTSSAAPPSRASTRSATSSPRPRSPTSASPRRILVVKDILGEDPTAGRLRPGAVVHLLPPRGRVRRADARRRPSEAGLDVVTSKHRYSGNGRALILGEPDGLVKIIAEDQGRRHRRPDPRRAHGRPVGDRAARPGLPRRQLGGHRRRGRRSSSSPTRR